MLASEAEGVSKYSVIYDVKRKSQCRLLNMELKLEVILSSSIKRKKPWPRFCWLGKEKESVFLLDDKRISEINMVSGRTRKRTPKLHPLLSSVVTMTSSCNGMWLCGLLVSGELFLWNRDKDLLKTAAAAPEVVQMITAVQGNPTRLSLQVSGDGMRVLLAAVTGLVFLWECADVRDLTGVRDGTVRGRWAHILPLEDSLLPCAKDKDASQTSIFIKTEVMGDACLTAFVFTSGKKLIITFLKIQWEESRRSVDSVGYDIKWATKTYPLSRLTPPCQPVKSRGALVSAFSPDGRLLAVVLNQRQPKATQVLFVSTQNFVSVSSGLGGCGSKKMDIPSKYIRSYWVGSVSWSAGGLFLACVLKRGSLLMVCRLGGLLTLTSSGCSVDFGPAHFLPLHPLVTYRPPALAGNAEPSLSSSSLSARDVFRQRYSVTWHPRLSYLIVSDGYMATVLRVLDQPSPALLLKTLLQDATKDLQKASENVDKSQTDARAWLESVSCLNLNSSHQEFNSTVTSGPRNTNSVPSATTDGATLPLFLQDQGTFSSTKELLEKVQTFFEDDSDLEGPPAGSHLEDGGRLDFASMFDTLHALETQTNTGLVTSPDSEKGFMETGRRAPVPYRQLGKIQSKLLTAWAFGMSFGRAVENRTILLKHTLCCVVRFAALLHLIDGAGVRKGKRSSPFPTSVLHLLSSLLSFLPWDGVQSDAPRSLGLVVDFSKRLTRLLLTPCPDSHLTGHCHLSSRSLCTALLVLRQVSDCLDHTYSLPRRTVWASAQKDSPPQLWTSDVHHVPQLQDEEEKSSVARPVPRRPSGRLQGAWRWVYKVTQQYMEELRSFKGCDGWEEEQRQLSVIVSQIQTALQATGEKLEDGPGLLSYPGEHLFLCGSYSKSSETWRSQICEESSKSCVRGVFKETQLCLALLYSLLSQYRLREAQELGDHMARLILNRAGHLNNTGTLPHPWLPVDLHSDAACVVIQTLGRFMASYFTNQPLYVRPPHHVASLPPLHLPHSPSVGRLVLLCQEEVSRAVRQQQLSEVWTVDYAQDMLLLGGLLPETVWLAYHLGDWKSAASLGLAFTNYCTGHFDFSRLRRREFHLPAELKPGSIFQAELQHLLGDTSDSRKGGDEDGDRSFTDPLEGEDWDMLQISIQEILKASVMAGSNVVSSPLSSLLDTAKHQCSCLPILVPNGLYLPSPPLYCPQPSPNTQDPVGTAGQSAEVASRHKASGVLQRLLLLLRSARCCRPAAQWYISHLRRARHILYKIRKKYSYPSAAEHEKDFPEGLMKFITRRGFFKQGSIKESQLDPDTIRTIVCFRELCALCWMLHVRDQLSFSCRKYQAARQLSRDEQFPADSDVTSSCVDALRWARRFLPFSCFLSAEEILQDVLLSLMSELPPLSLVADTVVEAFPQEEESVRVPLREKYGSLLQRLRQCDVLEGENEEANESMMIVIQDKRRLRRKHLGRLRRHLAPTELHLWEKKEDEEERGAAALKQLSLGTSVNNSTLTDCGFPPVCSDGDTADNASEAISPETHRRAKARGKKGSKGRKHANKAAVKITQEESCPGDAKQSQHPSLPTVGTWEFELEDEEYLNFLELFLSYMLGKDDADGAECGGELPLLTGFSSQLRESELHSLTFDVLTTVHRRQSERKDKDPPVFRAGCCYKPVKQDGTPEPQTSSVWNDEPVSRASPSVSALPGLRAGLRKGLFGLRQQGGASLGQRIKGGLISCETSTFGGVLGQRSESSVFGSSTSVEAAADLQQGLNPELEAEFPELGRLLEWMVRWADRRVLLRHPRRNKKERGGKAGGAADEGVVIRVKASTPAILTSLGMLRRRFADLLGADRHVAYLRVPEPRWSVAPVLQPEVDWRLERDSSVDTGYPASANTPLAALDHVVQQGEASIESPEDEPEEAPCVESPPTNVQQELATDAQQRPSSPHPLSLDDLDVTPEKEGKSSTSEGLDESSIISDGNVPEISCLPDQSLKLTDLDVTENVDEAASSSFFLRHLDRTQAVPQPEPQAPPAVHPVAEIRADSSGSAGAPLLNTPVEPPGLHPQSSTAAAPPADPTAPGETPLMRQRLGEDLFRLVQNINYMSLIEVLGASFSNLQLAQQQSSSLAQSNLAFSHPNVPAASFFPQPYAVPAQPNISVGPQGQARAPSSGSTNGQIGHVPACVSAEQPARHSAGNLCPTGCHHHATISLQPTANGVKQEMQPLSIQALSPDLRESRRSMSPSQGLLATTDTGPGAHAAPPFSYVAQNGSTPQVPVPKLLQLHPPLLAHHAAPHGPPAQTLPRTNPATSLSQRPEPKGDDQPGNVHSVPKRQLSSQHRVLTSQTSRGQEVSLPALPAATPALTLGLRLLQYQAPPQNNVSLPKLPVPAFCRPSTGIPVPVGDVPIKLLQIESGPKMMLPSTTTSAPLTRLLSMEELTCSAIGRQNAAEHRARPLSVEPRTESLSRANTLPNSSKRQKRREEKEERLRKPEVTFRPNESIIPSQEPIKEPRIEERAAEAQITPEPDAAFPFGSPDSSLTGPKLLERAASTSAELHAFASTCKAPPECHDAFTNTDPSRRPALVDKAVSVSRPASRCQSLGSENLPFSIERLVPDAQEVSGRQERNLGLGGRQFLSVLDLEDRAVHQDLPPSVSPAAPDVPSVCPSSPTSAQLHALAASVLRSASAAAPQPKVTAPESLPRSTSHTDIWQESLSLSHTEPGRDAERVTLEDPEAPSDYEICRAVKTAIARPQEVSSKRPTVLFSSRLSEMDAQLAALQNIADSLETDFSNSRMLVRTPAKLTAASATDAKPTAAGKKTVRLSVPQEAWGPRPNIKAGQKPFEAARQREDPALRRDSSTPQRRPSSSSYSTSPPSPTAAPSSLRTPPRARDEPDEGLSTLWEDESLGQSGLSDTTEMLDELVREGYLSASDLDFSNLRSTRHSRLERRLSSRMSQESERDAERRELRIWMRRKQREQLAVYQKHRESLREREQRPFSGTSTPTKKNQTTDWRSRAEREKFMLLEQYNRRTSEARSLVHSLSSDPLSQFTPSLTGGLRVPSATRLSSSPSPVGTQRTYSVPASDQRNPRPGQTQQHLQPGTAEMRGGLTEEQRRRLGLHRPATILPGDRLSHVTRRGMLSDPRSCSRMSSASQSEERLTARHQRTTWLSETPSGGTAVGRGVLRKQTAMEERRRTNLWESASGMNRLLEQEESDSVLAGASDEQELGARAAVSDMDWLDNLSESGSSNLSKIDWAAIERMVAAGEA